MTKFYTVAPVSGLYVNGGTKVELAEGLLLTPMPDWAKKDEMSAGLAERDRTAILQAGAALVSEYDADGLGSPDPAADDGKSSIQQRKQLLCTLANLAFWIRRPTRAQFSIVFHAPDFGSGPSVQQILQFPPLLYHPETISTSLKDADFENIARFHEVLASVSRDTALWNALWATWTALTTRSEPVRYSLLWIALEALFGPEDGREITLRLAQRIAFLIGESPSEKKELFRAVKSAYSLRSKIVHGRWKEGSGGLEKMAELELIVRKALGILLKNDGLRGTFASKRREEYLDELIFASHEEA